MRIYFQHKSIDNILKRVSNDNGYTFISHYDAINKYLAEKSGKYIDDLMETNSPHPTEEGYKVMWQAMQEKLELK